MAAANKDVLMPWNGTGVEVIPQLLSFPVAASTLIYAGTFGMTNTAGNAVTTPSASVKIWGRVEKQVDNSTGAAGDKSVEVKTGYYFPDNDATNPCTNAMRGSLCYAVDNHTAGSSDVGGTLPVAGVIVDVPGSTSQYYGKVCVAVGMGSPYVISSQLLDDVTAFRARNVATNLAALTFTGGSFSMDANGALGAQDGVTNVAGDVILFPLGTITTGVVSAANSGPWLLTSVGGASSKATGIRPSWWPHGDTIDNATAILVGGEGTLHAGTTWTTYAAATAVIGTDDPKLYPNEVIQQVTLGSGTVTITNVPIRSTSKVVVTPTLAGGTPAGTTTNYQTKLSGGIAAGGVGTGTIIVEAQSVAGTKVGTDASVLNVSIRNK